MVNALYNIVDQIFIGRGIDYLANGSTNVIMPLTILVMSLSLQIDGGVSAYLSLKLGESGKREAARGVGNGIIALFTIVVVTAVSNNALVYYGAQSIYGADIPLTT